MHDIHLAREIISNVAVRARADGHKSIRRLRVRIGAWTGTDCEHFRASFEAASRGTLVEGAELEIVVVEPVAVCEDCGTTVEGGGVMPTCPRCGSKRARLTQGRDVEVDEIEP